MKVTQIADGRWQLDSGEILGGRVRKLFATQAEAERYESKAKEIARFEGEKVLYEWLTIPAGEIREIVGLRRQMAELGGKVDWPQAQKLYIDRASSQTVDGLLPNLIQEYVRRKRKAGRNGDYVTRLERELLAFATAYPGKTAGEIGDQHIDSFLDSLDIGPVTRDNRIRDLSGLFSFAKKKNLCAINPADMTEPVKIVRQRIKAFSLQEMAVILWVSETHPEWQLTPYLAFNAWGSSRAGETYLLDWANYDPLEKCLVLEAAITKPNQERVTEDLPDVLHNWVAPYVYPSGPISPPETTVEWRRAEYLIPAVKKILPLFEWLRNGLRKSSISADYAVTKDAKGVAAKHGTSPEMVYRNYRKVMKKAEGEQYVRLTRAGIIPFLEGLIPAEELQNWKAKSIVTIPDSAVSS